MKVCILSMQRVPNFGSLLQSYSLKKQIESFSHEVAFIDIEPNENDNILRKGRIEDYSFETGKKGFLAKIKKIDRYMLNRFHIRRLSRKQSYLFEEFRRTELCMDNSNNQQSYDYCVIGSDEVFNCNAATPWGFTSQLFGNVKQAEKVITYAASCGSTRYENVQEDVRDKIKESFKRISAFSVRDKNTEEFVFHINGILPNIHLDPVLIGNFDAEIEREKLPNQIPERYCIVYSYYNRINDREEIDQIKKFCKKHSMEIVTVGAPQMWVRHHLVLTPFQMLKVFQNAKFVITDTFHGTIFAVKYAKKFATIVRASNENKLMDLLKRMMIENHHIKSMTEIEKAYSQEKPQEKIKQIISEEREKAISYLQKSL